MAKNISFSKLNLKNMPVPIEVSLNNDIILTVEQYLPQEKKIEFIQFVLQNCIDRKTGLSSPIREETFFMLGLAKWYGNITFTEKQIENASKTYDLMQSNGIFNLIIDNIPEEEYNFIYNSIETALKDIKDYNLSFTGSLSNITEDNINMQKQIDEIREGVQSPESLKLIKLVKDEFN